MRDRPALNTNVSSFLIIIMQTLSILSSHCYTISKLKSNLSLLQSGSSVPGRLSPSMRNIPGTIKFNPNNIV